jgi:hypothetical protein
VRDADSTRPGDQPEEELHLAALLDLIDESDLKPHVKYTLKVLARFGNWKTGTRIRPSLDEVARKLGKKRRQVNYDIAAALREGVLRAVGPVGPVRSKTGVVMTARRGGRARTTEFELDIQRLRERARPRVEATPQSSSCSTRKPCSPAHETLQSNARNPAMECNRSGSDRAAIERTRAAAAPQLEVVPEPDPDEHYAVITAVVTKDILPQRLPDEQLLAATMTRCDELHIPCEPGVARKAVDSALFRYCRALRLEFELPPDPRGIYHDHKAPVAIGLPTPIPLKPPRNRRARNTRAFFTGL